MTPRNDDPGARAPGTPPRPAVSADPAATAIALHQAGRLAEAENLYRAALKRVPNHFAALHGLGTLRIQQQRPDEAVPLLRKAINSNPNSADALGHLGDAYLMLNRAEDAIPRHQRALALRPDRADLHVSLVIAFALLRRFEEAVVHGEKAVALAPGNARAHNNLALALKELGRYAEAVSHFDASIASDPDQFEVHANRGGLLVALNRHAEAIDGYERALALRPANALLRSDMLFTMNYMPDLPRDRFFAAHRRWNEIHAPPERIASLADARPADTDRRLRIGYVSADFREHPVSYFLAPLLATHDRRQVEVFCYGDVPSPDAHTQRLKALADRWVEIRGMDTPAISECIRRDGIDILVDLAGHTGGNHLPVFVRKPAPVQIAWLGYPNTTGLDAIDYRITDIIADPDHGEDRFYSETLIRLKRCFLCYAPPEDAPAVAPPPASRSGIITFGSFNNIRKLTPQDVASWAAVLRVVPGSRLLLKAETLGDRTMRAQVLALFAEREIEPDRIVAAPWTANYAEHLARYGDVDIALDTSHYNGTTTTCEALWMGVPVVALRGDRHASRVGASLLTAVGMPEWIAEDSAGYVALAARLAADIDGLATLRAQLRERLRASPLCDAAEFAGAVEAVYRTAWRKFCDGARPDATASEATSPLRGTT